MVDLKNKGIVCFSSGVLFCMAAFFSNPACALEPKPDSTAAKWSGMDWGTVRVVPGIAKYGDKVHIHGIVIGGPASDPFWSCSQYEAWKANGTSSISITIPGDWDMPYTGHDIFGNKVNSMSRDGGDPPPYGWDERVSDTCYCVVSDFGASGGCQSREVQPDLFRTMDQFNPREGNVQLATVLGGSGWTQVSVEFGGTVGVPWSDRARDYVYVVSDEALLDEDSDNDDLPDAWELAHSPNQSLDDFAGGNTAARTTIKLLSEEDWVNPYAPSQPGWIPAGPNDWDGDGFSNKSEYLKWKNNTLDGNGWPYDPTFINTAVGCPATVVLKEVSREKDLATLRTFRDEVLSKKPAGQELIKLYYQWGPAIVIAMEEDEKLKEEIKEIVDGFLKLTRKAH